MNDDAAHREEHIGEHLQNADWNESDGRFSLRFAQIRYCPLLHMQNGKPPLRFPFLEPDPWALALDQPTSTSRQGRAGTALLGGLSGPDAADKGLSGFEISPCPLRLGDKRMSGRLRPAAHGTNMELRRVGRHQDVVHGHIQQSAQGVEVVHRGQALATLPLVDGLGLLKAEELLEIPDGQAFRLPQAADVGPRGGKVDDGELVVKHDNRLHSDSSVG